MDVAEDVAWRVTSPRSAALRMLAGRFQRRDTPETTVPLADFQKESLQRASLILERRGGVLIADSVGLGKTFVALALIENAIARGRKVLVVIPAALRRMWRHELTKLAAPGQQFSLTSHTQLTGSNPPAPVADRLIVVDEAHAFRNPRTRRYRVLRRLCRASRVVLLTATPINNSLADLYFLLRLFCSDGAFRDLGIGSLRGLLEPHPRPLDLARLKAAIIVRRTRAEARAELSSGEDHGRSPPVFRFPRAARTHALSYDLPVSVALLGESLSGLSFPAYRLDRPGLPADLLRFGMLKRMESSTHAIGSTLQRQIRFYEQFIAALQENRLLRPRDFRSLYTGDDASLQLVFDDVALEPTTGLSNPRDLIEAAVQEVATLRRWRASIRSGTDDKLGKLVDLLRARGSAKTIVFTEYRDTAHYLWSKLQRRFAVGLIHGGSAWLGQTETSRRHAVDCFAPKANGARNVHPRESINVLIATDVLAEGMNLQDADAVVSYDLPWNPVRLIQRAGRVDRIGSEFDLVHVFNFLPDREFDEFLGLARTIRNKLEKVRSVVGLERPVLDPEEDFETVARNLSAGNQTVLDWIEGDTEALLRSHFEKSEAVEPGPAAVTSMANSPKHLLLGLARDAEFHTRLFELETGDEIDGGDAVILRALERDVCVAFDPAPFVAAALAHVAEANRLPGASRLATSSAPARLARLIRRNLAELPIYMHADTFSRADAALEKLANVSDIGMEDDLNEIALRASSTTLTELLDAVENVFSRCVISPRDPPCWTLAALIVAD